MAANLCTVSSPGDLEDLFFTSEAESQLTDASSLSDAEFQDSLSALFKSIEPETSVDDTPCSATSPVPLEPAPLASLISATGASPPSLHSPVADSRPLASPESPTDNLLYHGVRQLLQTECKNDVVPSLLLQAVQSQQPLSITVRESALQARFRRLERSYSGQVRELSTLYRFHASSIEMERMEILADTGRTPHYRQWLSEHFDGQIHQVIDRVERSLDLLEQMDSAVQSSCVIPGVRRRPPLSRLSITLMENWYDANLHHPYPSAVVCEALAASGNICVEQVKKWFGNKRNRSSNTRSRSEIAKRKFWSRHGMAGVHLLKNFTC